MYTSVKFPENTSSFTNQTNQIHFHKSGSHTNKEHPFQNSEISQFVRPNIDTYTRASPAVHLNLPLRHNAFFHPMACHNFIC